MPSLLKVNRMKPPDCRSWRTICCVTKNTQQILNVLGRDSSQGRNRLIWPYARLFIYLFVFCIHWNRWWLSKPLRSWQSRGDIDGSRAGGGSRGPTAGEGADGQRGAVGMRGDKPISTAAAEMKLAEGTPWQSAGVQTCHALLVAEVIFVMDQRFMISLFWPFTRTVSHLCAHTVLWASN